MPTIQGLSSLAGSLAKLQQSYKTADSNSDGSISLSEFEVAAKSNVGLNGDRGQTAATTFKQLDTNGNGALTKAELTQGINLTTQVQAVLIQGQELQSSYLSLLTGTGNNPTSSLFGATNDYTSLTSNLLGSSSPSLTTILSGANTNVSTLASLFGGGNTNALLQQYIAKYSETAGL